MTRFGRIPTRRRIDLEQAFKYLGTAPTRRDLGLVADLLQESEVEVNYGRELREIAVANGSSAIDALDLATAVAYGVESLWAGPPGRG